MIRQGPCDGPEKPCHKPTSGDLSVQRGKDRRVCSFNHQYRSVIKLASLAIRNGGIAQVSTATLI